jgi:hypothetical protein
MALGRTAHTRANRGRRARLRSDSPSRSSRSCSACSRRSPGTPQHSSATRTTVSPPSAWSCTRPPSPASSSCSTCGECPAYALPTRMISERAGGLAGRRGQSLTGEAERTIVFGDSHQQFRRPGPNGTQVVNRGSVGAPGRRPPRSVGVLLRRRDPLPPNGVRHRADRRPLLAPAR